MPITLQLDLSARRLTGILLRGYVVVLLAHLIVVIGHVVLHRPFGAMTMLFDLDMEANVPVFFTCMLFFLLAALSALAARSGSKLQRRYWILLCIMFLFLGIDEGSTIHERFTRWTNRLFESSDHSGGLQIYPLAWVIPYSVAALVVAAVLLRFLWSLPPRTRYGLVAAGIIYLLGAVVMEVVGGMVVNGSSGAPSALALQLLPCDVYPSGECNFYLQAPYIVAYTIEESLEMLGVITCIHVLMLHLESERLRLNVFIPGAAGPPEE